MLKALLFKIRYFFSDLPFNRKKQVIKQLQASFGKVKNEEFNFELIEKYFRGKNHDQTFHVLSDKTCNDIDLDELFMHVDRTNSKVGQQYLYDNLRSISHQPNISEVDETIISELMTNEEFRLSIQKHLHQLNKKDAYYISTLFQDEHLTPPPWFYLVKILAIASFATLVCAIFNPLFFILLLGLFGVNLFIHYWNKNNLVEYTSSIPQLLKMNAVAGHLYLNPRIKTLNSNLLDSIKLIYEIKNRMSFFRLEARMQGEIEMIAWFFFELVKIMFLLEPLLLFGVLKRLNTKRNEIEYVFKFVGHVDTLNSIASVRSSTEVYCRPEIKSSKGIHAKNMAHPLIENCTSNSISTDQKSILLTGSNMSGKTSFIRTVGINVICGLTLNTCFAEAMQFPKLKIYSAIRISDDLMNDKSYYFEEVLTIKEMIEATNNGTFNLFLLDELFKGTNTVERIAAGKAVLSQLATGNNQVFVSTHDIELAELLKNEYELYHFSESVNEKTIGFDYRLKEGVLTNRNAIKILEINDYPDPIIAEAISIAKQLDASLFLNKREE